MSARDELINAVTHWLCDGVELAEKHKAEAASMVDAYRDEVLAEQRTTWPSAEELQQAAATKRASGSPEDIAVANLLNAVANALAWLAPYRTNEGGFEMWGAATTLAQLINGGAA